MKTGQQIGYIRVSTIDQNPDRQLEGVTLDKKFTDKVSGKNTDRPQLTALLEYVREDDAVLVHSMDRLARNADDLKTLVKQILKKQATVKFIKEGLTFTGDDSPISQLMLTMLGAWAEFDYALIKERQREGIALAKARGAYKGRKPMINDEKLSQIKQLLDQGETKAGVARQFNISRETLYKHLRKQKQTTQTAGQ